MINKKNRTACKACRLRKCLIVGMSKSGSRYGRRSNWFKIHCLLQEQQEKQQQQHIEGMLISPSASPYSFGLAPNGFMQKSHDEDFKTVSTPSTSPASSHISDTPSNGLDLLTKLQAGAAPPARFDNKHATTLLAHGSTGSSSNIPKDPSFYMHSMNAFPGMSFPLPPTNLAQLFFSGFGAPTLSHHYQDMLMAKPSPFLGMDQYMLQKQIEEGRHRAMMNSPPVSVSPTSPPRPLSCEAPSKSLPIMINHINGQSEEEEEEEEDIDISGEPVTKRQKPNPVCVNPEESSNKSVTVCKAAAACDDLPLDLSLTSSKITTGGNNTAAAHLFSETLSAVSSSHRQKYKGADCPAQTGEAAANDEVDDDVQVDVDDQKQTAFFDYFKQTFVRENQFSKIKNNEIYSF